MKKFFFTLFTLCLAVSAMAQGLSFNLYSNKTAEVTYLVYNSRDNYSGLTSATIPETIDYNGTTYTVTSIGEWAFAYCTSLTSITLPNSVTTIGEKAFKGCSSLTSITIPNSVTTIGGQAFKDCSSLTSVVWNAKNFAEFSSPIYAPFYDIRSQITSFTFDNSVEHIPALLCYGMSKLTSVTIGNSVTEIGNYGFQNCKKLQEIHVKATTPPDIREYTFDGVNHNIPVYVPEEAVNAYRYHQHWGDFNNIESESKAPASVTNIQSPTANSHKTIRNGQLIIDHNGKLYNILGTAL